MIAPTDQRAAKVDPATVSEAAVPARAVVAAAMASAAARIAPVWPLDRFVAVNPYVGLADRTMAQAASTLQAVGDISTTMPIEWYLDRFDEGRISDDALAEVLADSATWAATGVDEFLACAHRCSKHEGRAADGMRIATVADIATRRTGRDWGRLRTDRVSAFAAAHFDAGQASWRSTDASQPLFVAWRHEAEIDRTPEVMGLRGFRSVVRALPIGHLDAAADAFARLWVPEDAMADYCHALLLRVGGWAAHTSRLAFEAQLVGRHDDAPEQLLAILLAWEVATMQCLGDEVGSDWRRAAAVMAPAPAEPPEQLAVALVLQDALDRSAQRELLAKLGTRPVEGRVGSERRPRAQAVFCIDVRSEVFRRHLEAVAPEVETWGFAGFFGMAIDVLPLGHDHAEAQCPVLLMPGHVVAEALDDPTRTAEAVERRRRSHQLHRAWMSFKMGAISCFSFVGPVGLAYLPKLLADGARRSRPVAAPHVEGLSRDDARALRPTLDPQPDAPGIALADRVELAESALRAMSLTRRFAPSVLLIGHGATTTNNPFDTGLDCGACGGHTGEANARVAAAILNDQQVRSELVDRGIRIPADTRFVAAMHDTTTDRVTLFDEPDGAEIEVALAALREDLDAASRRTRSERASRLGVPVDEADPARVEAEVFRRSADWSQVRPEWGLAGCRAFVAAPRARTAGIDLSGTVFLHSYDWRQDDGFAVLNQILNAPVVVASWITLQYYASTVDNEHFGSGNKTLHNVVGRLGVLEGHGGDLRVGLPMQSIHDGARFQHEPLRLAVVVEAPTDAIDEVVGSSPHVRDLVEHGWLALYALDDEDRVVRRIGDGRWR